MKILFVANRVPYPPFRGDKLKIFNLAKQLHGDHELHLITIAETEDDLKNQVHLNGVFHQVEVLYLPKWKSLLNAVRGLFTKVPLQVSYFRFPEFQQRLDDMILFGDYDAVHIQHLRMSRFFLKKNREKAVLDLPDAFSLYWKRRSENARLPWTKLFTSLEYRRLKRYEKLVLPMFKINLVCSAEDQDYLVKLTGANVGVLPNGVDSEHFAPKPDTETIKGRVLFTGNMDYEPNIDAVEYFVSDLWPLILKSQPDAEFVIAGQRPVPRVLRLASDSVKVTGFVEDISIEYAKADVVVAPLRFGAGTQNKVLEALAVGTPVVCTEVGFKGLGLESGQGAILAADSNEFAQEVIHLLQNDEYRHRVAVAGSDIIRNKFGWGAIARQLAVYLSNSR